jgi:Domain of unknown function (DUF3387)
LIQLAKEFQVALEREAVLGLGKDEIAFYDALANNESAVRTLGDEILKKIAVELTEKLRASTTVDWQVRESVRARLRILVRRTLQKWKYPPRSTARRRQVGAEAGRISVKRMVEVKAFFCWLLADQRLQPNAWASIARNSVVNSAPHKP